MSQLTNFSYPVPDC